jgi:hypothetical protein
MAEKNPIPFQDWHVTPDLRPLVAHLRARYPGVEVTDARMRTLDDGTVQQSVSYVGPIDKLLGYGLVTPEMVARGRYLDDRRKGRHCPNGDGFFIPSKSDGALELSIHTGSWPRERERFSVRDAERELRRFMLPRRKGRAA